MLERFTGPDGRQFVVDALRAQPAIGEDADLAETIWDQVELIGISPGSTIIEELAPDNDICFILTGSVSIRVAGREVAVREASQHFGEMAVVDPGQPRSASVVAQTEVVLARVSAIEFIKLAESNPRLWRNIARELAARLRQRNRFVRPMNLRPSLFVGCSAEALPIGHAIQTALDHDPIEVKLWSDNIFEPSSFPIESLERQLLESDFAALVLSPDDTVVSRNTTSGAPRDNLVFELGLFMGALGHSRTFLVYPRGVDMKIPTDLKGITAVTYESGSPSQISTALESANKMMRAIIFKVGPR